ncbi:hypothetical protein TNCV_1045481 [Trichonephila clavipes]|nr:hypothetical protein TNCV_1045481 [Trichonephila clavipes]
MQALISVVAKGRERLLNFAKEPDMTACKSIIMNSNSFHYRYALCATLEWLWTPHIFYTTLLCARRFSTSGLGGKRYVGLMNTVSALFVVFCCHLL